MINITQTKKKFKVSILIGLMLVPIIGWGAGLTNIGIQKGSKVQKQTIQKGNGYELKNITYQNKRGNPQSIELIFIKNAQGAINAYNEIGLPANEKDEIIKNYKLKQTLNLQNHKLGSSQINQDLVVIDKELALATSNTEIESILLSRGMSKIELDTLKNSQSKSFTCWSHKDKTWRKSFDKGINKDWDLGNDASIGIHADFEGAAKAKLGYKIKKTLWCTIPYKIRMKKLTLRADYTLDGNLNIHGEVSHNVDGHTWDIAEISIANGVFFVGPIPVFYDIKLPITAGTGDLTLTAHGEIGIDNSIAITGHYEYGCINSHCSKISSSLSSNNNIDASTIQYSLMASAKIEPWAKVSIAGSIYWGFLEAEVGAKPSFPIALKAYTGNTCSDADGLNGNETVSAGIVNIDFRVGIEASAGGLWGTLNIWSHYWEIYHANLYFHDFIQPYSTTFSPVIRPYSNGLNVTLPVSLRSCMSSFVNPIHQDFTIHWGDGSTTPINDLSGTESFNHTYPQEETYEISVVHDSGASTTKDITLTRSRPRINYISDQEILCRRMPLHLDIQARHNPRQYGLLHLDIQASHNPIQFEVRQGNNTVYFGNNGSVSTYISIPQGTNSVNFKARAKNSVGWGYFRHFTVRCENGPPVSSNHLPIMP